MTRGVLLVVPTVGVVVALLAALTPAPVGVIIGGVVGVLGAAVMWAVERNRLIELARTVNDWVGRRHHDPVQPPPGPAWRQLAISLNALGAAYARRGARLDRARQQRERLVDALPDPGLLFDEEGYLVRANPAARSRFEIPDAGPRTAAQTLGGAQLSEAVTEAREAGRTITMDTEHGDRAYSVLATPVGDEVLLLITDRTEREHVDAVRRDFVANASHELKTPVAGIQALAEALEVTVGRDAERARSLVDRLAAESQHLGNLVRDLLDLRRLEEVRSEVGRTPVDLAAVVRDEAQRVSRRAGEREVTVDVGVPDRATLVGTEDDLRLIVANLLDNAVVYNRPGGRVEVDLERADGAWRLRVVDNGIGIARGNLDRIFERFYRVDVDRSRETGGTGLGLALVRHATQRHGGTVSVDSILGQGTTVTVVLPVEPRGRSRT